MAFYRKVHGTWQYRVSYKDVYTGKYKEKTKSGFARKSDAVEAANKLELDLSNGFKPQNQQPSLESYMYTWFNLVKDNYRYGTQISRLNSIERISKKLGKIQLKDLNADIISKYLQEMSSDCNLASSTINSDYVVIKKTIEQAIRSNYIYQNPLLAVVKPKAKPQKKARYWSLADLEKFIQLQNIRINQAISESHSSSHSSLQYVTRIRDLAMICVLAGSGVRVGELCGLLVSSYDSSTQTLSIHHNYVSTTKSGKSDMFKRTTTLKTTAGYRDVPLPDTVAKNLELWLATRKMYMDVHHLLDDDGSMFPSPHGVRSITPYDVRGQVNNITKRFNLPSINVHGFRHTYASFLLAANVAPKRAQALLGHKDIKTTLNIYTHVSAKEKVNAVAQLNQLFENIHPNTTDKPKKLD